MAILKKTIIIGSIIMRLAAGLGGAVLAATAIKNIFKK